MWIDYKKVNNLTTAETWKNLLEAEGLPTKIIPENGLLEWSEYLFRKVENMLQMKL